MKKIYIESLGCSKNQVDSEKMLFLLNKNDCQKTESPEEADCIIINTCCFIKSAKEEAIETILELIEYKKKGKCKKIVVAGCLAQYYSKALLDEIPEIDLIFGIGNISLIIEALNNKEKIIIPNYSKDEITGRSLLSYPGSAYLKISEGCSNYCSYCVIPYIRGPFRSRDIYNILEELNFLKKQGIREIIIISQDTARYGTDLYKKNMLSELINQIESVIDKDDWIRLLYLHPDHLDMDMMSKLKDSKKLIPYFDIPFQSGSNKILKLMNRKNTNEYYLDLINNLRSIFKDPVLRSTFITGFPGENDTDFKETLAFIKEAKFDWVGGFIYSKENNTEAKKLKGHLKDSIKSKRLKQLLNLTERITLDRLKRFIGTEQKILIEEKVEKENLYIGRFWGQAPEVDGLTVVESNDAKVGDFIKVEIKKLNGIDFYAKESS